MPFDLTRSVLPSLRLTELNDIRKTAERELETLRDHAQYVNELEQNRDALLDSLERAAPDVLDSLTSKERHQVYKMLRLNSRVDSDGSLEIRGAFDDNPGVYRRETASGLGLR